MLSPVLNSFLAGGWASRGICDAHVGSIGFLSITRRYPGVFHRSLSEQRILHRNILRNSTIIISTRLVISDLKGSQDRAYRRSNKHAADSWLQNPLHESPNVYNHFVLGDAIIPYSQRSETPPVFGKSAKWKSTRHSNHFIFAGEVKPPRIMRFEDPSWRLRIPIESRVGCRHARERNKENSQVPTRVVRTSLIAAEQLIVAPACASVSTSMNRQVGLSSRLQASIHFQLLLSSCGVLLQPY